MQTPADRCALAVMAKAPVPGQVKTRLCPPLTFGQAACLARCFILDTLAKVRTTGGATAYLAYTPDEARKEFQELAGEGFTLLPQEGQDLGERMHHLSRGLFAAGHPAVAILGTDSPTLPAAVLASVIAHLAGGSGDLVLGPSEDGGYYLIGMRRPLPELFGKMPWGTAAVLAETEERARRLGLRLELLPSWFDVDTPPDLVRLRADLHRDRAGTAPHTTAYLRDLISS